ncbi:hypothetical protein KY285_025854 [Solanum tuberosum]|nr:hypothetical protein KY285_025854 [Solanum tuberosum]
MKADSFFDEMSEKYVVSWIAMIRGCLCRLLCYFGRQSSFCVHLESIPARNSIIGGYARHGLAERAMQEFERMLKSGIRSGSIARSMWLALMSRARRDCSKWNLHIGARPSCIILGAFQNLWIQRSVQ